MRGWARGELLPGVSQGARFARVRTTAGRVNGAAVMAALLIAAAYYVRHAPLHDVVWTQWFDQSMYLRAARAWAAGNLDPTQHWYLPGYPLLGAAFLAVTPDQPFWVPDLLCLLWSVWLCGALAARLMPGWASARAGGTLVAGATVALSPLMLEVWLVPWSTTPTVPLTLAALLLALRFDRAPAPGTAGLAALVTVGVAVFRPTDALVVLATVPPFMAWRLLAAWPGARRAAAIAGAALLGAALAGGALAAAHRAVFGLAPGAYLANSAAVGFEWRRIPLQWVTLFISPQPMFATHVAGGALGGAGMMAVFPWIIPGLAGIGACLVAGGAGRWRGHGLVAAVMALHIAVYLAYRDMHPDGLWRFENFHYFKVVLFLFGVYAVFLAYALARPSTRGRALIASAVVLAPLLFWRASFARIDGGEASIAGVNAIALRHGLAPVGTAVAVTAAGRWDDIYGGNTRLSVAGQPDVLNNSGVKANPEAGGFIAIPLRPLPAVPSVLWVDPRVRLDPSFAPVSLRQRLRFGLPCLVPGWMAACEVPRFAAGPALWAGSAVRFGGPEEPYLLEGWSGAEATGRWTEGPRAGLLLRPEGVQGDAVLALTAHPFLPRGGPMRVVVRAGSEVLATWVFENEAERTVAVRVPAGLLDAQGTASLQMAIERPSRSPDRRWLGLYVTSMRLE